MLTLTINSQAVQLNETDCLELIDCLRNEIAPQAFEPFARNYTTVAGIDKIIPVDMYIPGCPPRPETVIDALLQLQSQIQNSRQPIFSKHGGKQPHPELPRLLGKPIDGASRT